VARCRRNFPNERFDFRMMRSTENDVCAARIVLQNICAKHDCIAVIPAKAGASFLWRFAR